MFILMTGFYILKSTMNVIIDRIKDCNPAMSVCLFIAGNPIV